MAKQKNVFTSTYTHTYCDSIPAFQRANPLMSPQIYLELIDHSVNSEKFYKVSINPVRQKLITNYGRIGTKGSFIEAPYNNAEFMTVLKTLAQKLKKGYIEKSGPQPSGDTYTLPSDITDILEPCNIQYTVQTVQIRDLNGDMLMELPRTFESDNLVNYITFNYAKKVY